MMIYKYTKLPRIVATLFSNRAMFAKKKKGDEEVDELEK
jgi:hypothetical protein